jgi:energy-coupling factor transporter ATP-binding protein EcfA2
MVELWTCRDTLALAIHPLAGTVAIHPMLTVSQVSKSFAGRILFEDVSLQVNRGDRIGLVGPNRAGKSTLVSSFAATCASRTTRRGARRRGCVLYYYSMNGADRESGKWGQACHLDANEEFEALFPKFQPSRVPITTNSGASHSTRVDVPKGDPRDPMTEEEIAVKFTALGGDVVGKDQCKKLQRFIMSMETAEKLDQLFELTTARA